MMIAKSWTMKSVGPLPGEKNCGKKDVMPGPSWFTAEVKLIGNKNKLLVLPQSVVV
jgi:hypothetical protein